MLDAIIDGAGLSLREFLDKYVVEVTPAERVRMLLPFGFGVD